jgi:hypothetical protein
MYCFILKNPLLAAGLAAAEKLELRGSGANPI